MLLFIPTERKYKKEQKGKKFNRVQLTENITNNFITRLGLKSLQSGRVTSKQLNSFLRCLRKYLKKKTVLIKLSIFPHTPITKKPVGVRMGKGKGNVWFWISKVRAGCSFCDITFVNVKNKKKRKLRSLTIKVLKYAQRKLPFDTKILYSYVLQKNK